MVYTYIYIKNCEHHWYQNCGFLCDMPLRILRVLAWNGTKLFLTLQASIYVNAHHIDLGFVRCKKCTLWFSLFGWKNLILILHKMDNLLKKNLFNGVPIEVLIISMIKWCVKFERKWYCSRLARVGYSLVEEHDWHWSRLRIELPARKVWSQVRSSNPYQRMAFSVYKQLCVLLWA